MATVARQGELQVQIARELFGLLGGLAWRRAELVWSSAGGVSEVALRTWDEAGDPDEPDVQPAGIDALFRELKETMSSPDAGAWLSAGLTLTVEGQYNYDYNYDRRFYWDSGLDDMFAGPGPGVDVWPDDDMWVAEFAAFPRRPEAMPAWAPEARPGPSEENLTRLSRALAADVSLPAELAGLDRQPGWPELLAAIRHEVITKIQSEDYLGLLDELDRHDSERAFDGLWQDVYAVLGAPLIEKGPAARPLALWRGVLAVRGERPTSEDEGLDPSRPLPRGSRPYDDLFATVVALIKNEVVQRFPPARG